MFETAGIRRRGLSCAARHWHKHPQEAGYDCHRKGRLHTDESRLLIEVGAVILYEYGGLGSHTAAHLAEGVYKAMVVRAGLPKSTGWI